MNLTCCEFFEELDKLVDSTNSSNKEEVKSILEIIIPSINTNN